MKFLPVSVALAFSAAAGIVTMGAALPPPVAPHAPEAVNPVHDVTQQKKRRKPADCHRDVRTHRIDGVMIRHRHVGDDCAVREVRKVDSY